MRRWLGAIALLCACGCWVTSVHAGDGGGAAKGGGERGGPGALDRLLPPPPAAVLYLILQHATDLKLTAEQTAKLTELKKALPQTPPKPPLSDPEVKELFKKVREAMKNGDKDQAQELHKQLAEKLKQINPEGQKTMEAIKAILSPEQVTALKELWKQQAPHGGGHGQGGQGEKQGGGHGGGGPPPLDF